MSSTALAVQEFSAFRREPEWMTESRLRALDILLSRDLPLPEAADVESALSSLFRASAKPRRRPGVSSIQRDAEAAYRSLQGELERQGGIFTDMDTAVREHTDLVRQHWGTLAPPEESPYTALNGALWSGGAFIYVPAGVEVNVPLQSSPAGQPREAGPFERALIIAEPGSSVHYVEGCTAPVYVSDPLRSTISEAIVKHGAHVSYTSLQNWAGRVHDVSAKRAAVERDGTMVWIDVHLGARLALSHPSIALLGAGARGEVYSLALATAGGKRDTGAKLVFGAPHTSGAIVSRAVSSGQGRTGYQARIEVSPGTTATTATVRCGILSLDPTSDPLTPPRLDVKGDGAGIDYESGIRRLDPEQLFYLMSRGLTETEARKLVVVEFLQPVTKRLPMEYAVEMDRLIDLQIEGDLG